MKFEIETEKWAAVKAKNTQAVIVYNEMLVAINDFEKSKNRPASELEEIDLLKKIEKNIKESTSDAISLNRQEVVDELTIQLTTIRKYLPKEAGKEEVESFIDDYVKDNNIIEPKQMGLVMKALKEKFGNTVDMKVAGDYAKTLISK